MDELEKAASTVKPEANDVSRFAESYESFNRIINSLQRKYVELKDEFAHQNRELAEANQKLVELTHRNMAATDFLSSVIESIAAGVVAVDQNGRITHFNPAASTIFGIPRNESIGRHYRDVLPPGEPVFANALRTAESARPIDAVEKRIELRDGTLLQLSVSTSLLKDEQGRTAGAVEVLHDLTKVKKMEREISRLNTLATLGEMAAAIAHEVRNPLSGIGGFAALLEREIEEKSPQHKLVKKIIRGVRSLNETITSLLNYTKLEELNLTRVNYREYLEREIEAYRQENPDKINGTQIVVRAAENGRDQKINTSIDQLLFRQVLTNIINNAVEVSDGQGKVEVSFSRLSRQAAVARYSRRLLLGVDETVIETIISDDGPGIPMENLDQLFAPFFTTKQGGHGLGLAISSKIIKAHGGEIFTESSSQKGTSFCIIIPTRID